MRIRLTAPSHLRHKAMLPASKSISNRVLVIDALAGGGGRPENVSDCDDTLVLARGLSQADGLVDVMAAGTAMRFLAAYWAVNGGTHTLTGTARMKRRPIGILVDALRTLGARIEYLEAEGYPPVRVSGGTREGGRISLPGDVSSQYVSALLMVGPVMSKGLELVLTGRVVSRPYIDLTLKLMKDFGARAEWTDGRHIKVEPERYRPTPCHIENDWSAASYWYEMTALTADAGAEVTLPGLSAESGQGDSAVRGLFGRLGVRTEFPRGGARCAVLTKCPVAARRMECDFADHPDLAQTFVVTCAMKGIPFRFTGLQSLKIKETDRLSALVCEMGKLGYPLREVGGAELLWDGSRTEAPPCPAIDTYEDHRMAMAFAPCCLAVPEIFINHPQVVSKSYPRYWDDLAAAGFEITDA